MKKIIISLLIMMSIPTICSSQNIWNQDSVVTITSKQLKEANLIFIEHKKLLNENNLLYKQIDNYRKDSCLLIQLDSINNVKINDYKNLVTKREKCIKSLEKDLSKSNKRSIWTGISGLVIGLLFTFIK